MDANYKQGVVDAFNMFKVAAGFFAPASGMMKAIWNSAKGVGSALSTGAGKAMAEGGSLKDLTGQFAAGTPGRAAASRLVAPAALLGGGAMLHGLLSRPKRDPYGQPY